MPRLRADVYAVSAEDGLTFPQAFSGAWPGFAVSNLPKQLAYSLCIFAAIALGPFFVMGLIAREPFEGPLSLAIGLFEILIGTLLCVGICRTLNRMPGTLVGAAIGLIIPPCVAWIEIQMAMEISRRWWMARVPDSLGLWNGGLVGSIPFGVAGAIVGFLQSGSRGDWEECPWCSGRDHSCPQCAGTGWILVRDQPKLRQEIQAKRISKSR